MVTENNNSIFWLCRRDLWEKAAIPIVQGRGGTYHFHSTAVDEFLCSYTVDFINEPLLVRKETIQLFCQFFAHPDAEFVSLIEALHNWEKGKKKLKKNKTQTTTKFTFAK